VSGVRWAGEPGARHAGIVEHGQRGGRVEFAESLADGGVEGVAVGRLGGVAGEAWIGGQVRRSQELGAEPVPVAVVLDGQQDRASVAASVGP
jgi:hypothetical protein